MTVSADAPSALDNLRDGFTIGDVRVDPSIAELSSEDGRTITISSDAVELLLILAEKQPHSIGVEEAGDILRERGVEKPVGDLAQELDKTLNIELDHPGYVEIQGNRLRLLPAVELAGHGRFAGVIALWREIRKRRVFRVATTYAILTFIILQIADAVLDTLAIPPEYFSIMLAALAVGFPVVVLLAWFFEVTPQGIFLDRRSTGALMNRPIAVAGILLLAGIAIGFAFAVFRFSDLDQPVSRDDVAIAVLPFDNMTSDPAAQDVGDGIVEELLNHLARLNEIRVVGRKASFYFRDREEDWQTIADTLGANMIIEGSIRQSDDTLRVAAQLIDREGYHLWSNTFDAPTGSALDILKIQRSIAQQVAAELPIRLSDESRRVLQYAPTTNEEAYQLYMQGRRYLRDADQLQRFHSAEELFSDALEADPTFTDALAGLCETQARIYQRGLKPSDFSRAAATCTRLVSKDELNAEGYVALGTLNRLSGNYVEAETLFKRALDIDPDHEPAIYGLARSVEGQGRYEEAEEHYLDAIRKDPGYWAVYNGYGRYLERGGNYEDAIEQYRKAVRLAPDNIDGYTNLGGALFDSDQWEEALAAWQKVLDIYEDPIGHMNVGTAQYYLGDYQAAEASFRAGISLWQEFYPLWGKLGATLERQGRPDEARQAFENAAEYARAVLEVNSQDERAMYYLASYLAHLGRFDEARRWIESAVAISPNNPVVYYFSAIIESLAGNDDIAISALAEALKRGYSSKIILNDPYFRDYLDAAELAEWYGEDTA